ncbi:MAG: hypothetical protein V1799_21020 [bacterium]
MGIFTALRTGIKKTNRSFGMIGILYLINGLFAVVLALAVQSVLASRLGSSLALNEMLSDFDFQVFDDFLQYHGGDISALFRQILWLFSAYMLVNTFTVGGVLARLRETESPFSLRSFFAGCGEYFGRFLRLLCLILPVVIVVSIIWGGILSVVFSSLSSGASSEVPVFYFALMMILLFLLPIMLLAILSDYAKIAIVLHSERSVLKSFRKSFLFILRNFFSTMILQIFLLLLALLFFAVYVLLDLAVGMSDGMTIIVMAGMQQLFILSKMWNRSVAYGAQLSLYENRTLPDFAIESIELTPPLAGGQRLN